MCIAVPVRIVSLDATDHAIVDYGGLQKVVSVALVKNDVQVDDYVLVHAGCAIQRIDSVEARETLDLLQAMLDE